MKEIALIVTLIGTLQITSYRSVRSQTDRSPFFTSIGERVHAGGCAVSRDLLCPACRRLHHRCKHPEVRGRLHYGDWVYVDGYGFRQVNDVMGTRQHYWVRTKHGRRRLFKSIRRAIDIWVGTWKEEHAVNVRHRNVYQVEVITWQLGK